MVQLQSGEQKCFKTKVQSGKYIIAKSSIMEAIKSQAEELAINSSPTLILGEDGTGKKMIAEYIYRAKHNTNDPFYHINCYSLDSDFIKSEIFKNKNELFSRTEFCTLYVQGIEQLSLEVQSLLLKIVQDCTHRMHFIASSREDLPVRVENGSFLPELFHYLGQSMIIVPSLKERVEDISGLMTYFLKKSKYKKSISSKALKLLEGYNWKGNVAELENVCERLNVLSEDNDTITVDHLTEHMKNIEGLSFFITYNPKITLDELTNYYISEALKRYKSKKMVAKALGISVKTIYNKIEKGLV